MAARRVGFLSGEWWRRRGGAVAVIVASIAVAGYLAMPASRASSRGDGGACAELPSEPGMPSAIESAPGTVVLSWRKADSGATAYVVQVGNQPGANDLPEHVVRDPDRATLTVEHVPPGTYYVRVVARNRCGDGPPSPYRPVTVE